MESILVIEDNPDTREWLCGLAEEAFPGAAVDQEATLQGGRSRLSSGYNLALVDLSLPDGSGVDILIDIQTDYPDTFAVVTTIYDDDRHLFDSIRAGAKGYLLKDQPRERLVTQLKGIARGDPPLSPGVSRRILRYLAGGARRAEADAPRLTDREMEVLSLLSRGFNRHDIGKALNITANTAAGYVKSIYRKLHVSGRAEAIREAIGHGLVSAGGNEDG
jgi:DNA-binding NarL/FixJ family response regulator